MTSYQTAKFALLGLMRALAAKFGKKNINVNAVAPSMMDTQFLSQVPHLVKELAREKSRSGKLVSTTSVAQSIAFLLSEDALLGVVLPIRADH
jgi:3-oxoacyl-[acyl-carrier protein] reductase